MRNLPEQNIYRSSPMGTAVSTAYRTAQFRLERCVLRRAVTARLASDGFCPGRQLFFVAFRSSRHGHATHVQCARGGRLQMRISFAPGGLVRLRGNTAATQKGFPGSFEVALKARMKCRWERPITSPEPQTCPNRSPGTLRRGVKFSAGKERFWWRRGLERNSASSALAASLIFALSRAASRSTD